MPEPQNVDKQLMVPRLIVAAIILDLVAFTAAAWAIDGWMPQSSKLWC